MNRSLLASITSFLLYWGLAFANTVTLPPVTNFTADEYGAHTQNWAITQDPRGVLFFGNLNGVLQYDGNTWNLIYTKNQTGVGSVDVDENGRIYVGAYGEFGFIEPDSTGAPVFVSLSEDLPDSLKDFTIVWNTHVVGQKVFYNTTLYLFVYDGDTLRTYFPERSYGSSFRVDNQYWILESGKGIFEFRKDKLVRVLSNEQLRGIGDIKAILATGSAPKVMISRTKGIFTYDPNNHDAPIVPLSSELQQKLEGISIYDAIRLNSGDYALATLRQGVLVVSQNGRIIESVSRKEGLQNQKVHALHQDAQHQLWTALDNGISNIAINQPLSFAMEGNGFSGGIQSMARMEDHLYFGTSQGVYVIDGSSGNDDPDPIRPVEGHKSPCFGLISVENGVLATGYNVKFVQGNVTQDVTKSDGTRTFCKVFNDPDKVLATGSDGVYVFAREKGAWKTHLHIDRLPEEIYISIRQEHPENISGHKDTLYFWMGTMHRGVVRLGIDKDFSGYTYRAFPQEKRGMPKGYVNVFNFRTDVVFTTDNGLLYYEPESQRFEPYGKLGKRFSDGSMSVSEVIEMPEGDIWMQAGGYIFFLRKQDDGSYDRDSLSFFGVNIISPTIIFPDRDGICWFGGTHGLARYDAGIQKDYLQAYPALIRKVMVNEDSTIFGGMFLQDQVSDTGTNIASFSGLNEKETILPYGVNRITFTFSAPFYEHREDILFSCYLEGFDDDWGKWKSENKAFYNNLSEGTYQFQVKARNIYNNESRTAQYTFTILPPWYRTVTAYFIYGITGIGFIYLLIFLNSRRLLKAKRELETIVQERTREIEEKNTSLEKAYYDIEKLSLVASKTENAVIIADNTGAIEWVNDGFTRLSGFTLEDVKEQLGTTILDISNNKEIRQIIQEGKVLKKSIYYESNNFHKDGHRFWTSSTLTPIYDDSGKLKRIVIIDTDITNIREAYASLEKKNKQITQSINYAKRIQDAILPLKEEVRNIFKDSFIFFKPRDIVSGDFYWFSTPNAGERESKNGKQVLIAAADCTGHGVPGAFMSMVGNSLLNEIVNEKGISKPSKILNELREGIIKSLKQSGDIGESRDGMDIALCNFDLEKMEVSYSGAYNPLYQIRNGELTETKGDKYPIGVHYRKDTHSFTNHTIKLRKNDAIYLFSDGFPDQFGGSINKKYTYKRFRRLLLRIHQLPMAEQELALERELMEWKGNNSQLDDILVIGIRV